MFGVEESESDKLKFLKKQQISLKIKLNKYNLTQEKYNEILKSQNETCKICKTYSYHNTNLSIDHCHKTGKVRGLLCRNCNLALGLFNDDIELLKESIKYLESNKILNFQI